MPCLVLYTIICALFLACSPVRDHEAPVFHAHDNPANLSEWGQINLEGEALTLGENVIPYTLSSPLFTDYAHKLRTVWMPEGVSADYAGDNDVLRFPVGTVITKTFYYPKAGDDVAKSEDQQPVTATSGLALSDHRLMETRLLVHRENGWEAVSYVWNETQTEAKLTRIGAVYDMTLIDGDTRRDFTYAVPNQNQCAGCHMPNAVDKVMQPLGPRPYFLNTAYPYADGTRTPLAAFQFAGYLPLTERDWPALGRDSQLNEKARAYLDMNCAHCHNPKGPASTSGLHLSLESDSLPNLGLCKPPIAAGSGTGGRKFSIIPGLPDASIFTYRMDSRDPGAMMPELGRSLTHEEGVALVSDWIAAMKGHCAASDPAKG